MGVDAIVKVKMSYKKPFNTLLHFTIFTLAFDTGNIRTLGSSNHS